jgi:spermidine synthase
VNTDDNLYLEFSAPFSIATPAVMADNITALGAYRESLLPYLAPAPTAAAQADQQDRWSRQEAAGRIGDAALALFLGGRTGDAAFTTAMATLARDYPAYAPGRFLRGEQQAALGLEPGLIQQATYRLLDEGNTPIAIELSAVLVPISATRASVMFVDNKARIVYGQIYVDGSAEDGGAGRVAAEVMRALRAAYDEEALVARVRGRALPPKLTLLDRFKAIIESKVQGARATS